MRKGDLTREQAIRAAGLAKVEELEALNCDFTNRLQTDGDEAIEFAATVDFVDVEGTQRALTAYYYQYQEDLDRAADDLGRLDWDIEGYEVW